MTTGRVALVTGASRGHRTRHRHRTRARRGARVAVGYSSDGGAAAATVAEIEAAGGDGRGRRDRRRRDRDRSTPRSPRSRPNSAPVEILVNNAGVTGDGLLVRMSDDSGTGSSAVNLTGAFHTIRRATPKMMRARFGRIINVSSVVAHLGGPGQANYAAAKAGLLGLSRRSPGSSRAGRSPATWSLRDRSRPR